jgi:hypothetical protein
MKTREKISLSAAIMILILGLSMAFLSGCADDYYCDAHSANGLCIQYESHYLSPEVIDDALTLTWLELLKHYSLNHKRYNDYVLNGSQITITLHDTYIDCHLGDFSLCNGITRTQQRHIEVRFPSDDWCVSDTALVHEFLHLIPGLMGIGSDGNHDDDVRWKLINPTVNEDLRWRHCRD